MNNKTFQCNMCSKIADFPDISVFYLHIKNSSFSKKGRADLCKKCVNNILTSIEEKNPYENE